SSLSPESAEAVYDIAAKLLAAVGARQNQERDRARARPPLRPPLRDAERFSFFPRPDPLFFPPPVSLFTVAQARRSASLLDVPRFSYPSSMCSALRFCLLEYFALLPRAI